VNSHKAATLDDHVTEIRRLGRRAAEDIIEIGRRLDECQKIVRGRWLSWLENELGLSDETARRFISVFKLSRSHKLWNLEVPVSGLYLLASPGTPNDAITEVVDKANTGVRIKHAEVKAIVTKHKAKTARTLAMPKSERETVGAAKAAPADPKYGSLLAPNGSAGGTGAEPEPVTAAPEVEVQPRAAFEGVPDFLRRNGNSNKPETDAAADQQPYPSPIDRCTSTVRSAILTAMGETTPDHWGELFGQIDSAVADVRVIADQRRAEVNDSQPWSRHDGAGDEE
jgi:hypothetical protein